MVPSNSAPLLALGQVAADLLQRVGMNVEVYAVEFNAMLQRRNRKGPVSEGGWSAFVTNWSGMDWLNPAGYIALRGTGESGYAGWATTPRIETLRDAWFTAPDEAARAALCRDIQLQAMEDVPYYPPRPVPAADRIPFPPHRDPRRVSDLLERPARLRITAPGPHSPGKVGGAMASGPRPAQSSCRICASARPCASSSAAAAAA